MHRDLKPENVMINNDVLFNYYLNFYYIYFYFNKKKGLFKDN
jgi:serine/threonine protein kinase